MDFTVSVVAFSETDRCMSMKVSSGPTTTELTRLDYGNSVLAGLVGPVS